MSAAFEQQASGICRTGGRMKQRIMWVLWPAFVVAAVAEMLFFAMVDPGELSFFGHPLELSHTAIYSLFFFFFWIMAAVSSTLTCFLERTSA
jgi:hypothetical protein